MAGRVLCVKSKGRNIRCKVLNFTRDLLNVVITVGQIPTTRTSLKRSSPDDDFEFSLRSAPVQSRSANEGEGLSESVGAFSGNVDNAASIDSTLDLRFWDPPLGKATTVLPSVLRASLILVLSNRVLHMDAKCWMEPTAFSPTTSLWAWNPIRLGIRHLHLGRTPTSSMVLSISILSLYLS